MKHFFTLLAIVFCSFAGWTQYTRSLFYSRGGGPLYRIAIVPEGNNLKVLSVGGTTDDTLRIAYSELDELGNVLSEAALSLVNQTIGSKVYLSGAIAHGNSEYTLALLISQASYQSLGYVRVNLSSSTVINSYFPTQTYRAGFTETVVSGADLVTYLFVPAVGLLRVAVPVNGLFSTSSEVVDPNYIPAMQGVNPGKASEPLLVGGFEFLLAGHPAGANLYRRNSNGGYVSTSLSTQDDGRLVDLAYNSNGDFFAVVNDSCFQLNPGNLSVDAVHSVQNPTSPDPPTGSSDFFCYQGKFYRYRESSEGPHSVLQFDNLWINTSTYTLRINQRIQQAILYNNILHFFGSWFNLGFYNHTDEAGVVINPVGAAAFITRADNFPQFELPVEYSCPFNQDELRINLGQEGQLFVNANGHAVDLLENYKEYIQNELVSTLSTGKTYLLSYYVNRANKDDFTCNISNIGALFTKNKIFSSNALWLDSLGYSVKNNTSNPLSDTLDWVEVKLFYTAQGNEKFVTIGSFNSTYQNDIDFSNQCDTTGFGFTGGYFFIDDVSLSEIPFIAEFPNAFTPNNDGVNDSWNPTIINGGDWKIDILNRWGNLVTTLNQNNPNWTNPLETDGVYFYHFSSKDFPNENRSGFIHLIH